MVDNSDSKGGTRVFKKSSLNGKITVYIGKRDYLERNDHIDPIDGVVLIDPEYVKDRKVFVHILAAFRYGREDLDVLGLTFRKDLYLDYQQLYPKIEEDNCELNKHHNQSNSLTRLQSRLMQKLGSNAYAFFFNLPRNCPASVTLQPAPEDVGKPCGVDYELKVYVAKSFEEKTQKRSCVKLAIRKLTFAFNGPNIPTSDEVIKEFRLSSGKVVMDASLDKQTYFHGESISVTVSVDNTSTKTIKKIKLQVLQIADIMLFTRAVYKCVIDEIESEKLCPINPGQTGWLATFSMCPLLSNNRHKRGLALDGKLRHEDTNLASSTVVESKDNVEDLGIVVSYKVRIRLILGFTSSDIQLELPFNLTHPNPEEDLITNADDALEIFKSPLTLCDNNEPINSQAEQDDDLIFEDFARLKLDVKDLEENNNNNNNIINCNNSNNNNNNYNNTNK